MSNSRKSTGRPTRRSAAVLRSSRRGSLWGATIGVAVVPPHAIAQGVVVGQADAPVTIDLYQDFQCPACRQLEQQIGPTLEDLVAAGTAKVVYHPVAYLDQFSSTRYSSRSSAAAGCTAAAGVFARFHELLFANQPPEGGDGLSTERLIALGMQAGATGGDFATCVREEQYLGWTANVTDAASRDGINATPTVLVNGEPLPRPTTPQALQQAVQRAS